MSEAKDRGVLAMSEYDPLLDATLMEIFSEERPKHDSREATWAAVAGKAIAAHATACEQRDAHAGMMTRREVLERARGHRRDHGCRAGVYRTAQAPQVERRGNSGGY